MNERELERYYTSCSRCGGEIDSEGWCPSYCTNDDCTYDDPPLVREDLT